MISKSILKIKKILPLLLIACGGCGDGGVTPLYLTQEFYSWECVSKSEEYPVDRVIATTSTCDESVIWIVSELHYTTGQFMKQRLYKDADCRWQVEYPLVQAGCENVEGVTLTAWVNSASWPEVLFEEQ